MNKRFWLFGGEVYYPKKGMMNFIVSDDNIEALVAYANTFDWFKGLYNSGLWWNIFDAHEMKIIKWDDESDEYLYERQPDYHSKLLS